jgi:hypothetical protein
LTFPRFRSISLSSPVSLFLTALIFSILSSIIFDLLNLNRLTLHTFELYHLHEVSCYCS